MGKVLIMERVRVLFFAERVRALFFYSPETGDFMWAAPPGKKAGLLHGRRAGHKNRDGYLRLGLGGRHYLVHRLIWLYVHSRWPTGDIDHINRNRSDNRLVNLREVSRSVNLQNREHSQPNSISGLLGASYVRATKKWEASIQVNKDVIHLGTFPDAEAAHRAYLEAKRRLHEGCTI